ncbi:Soluble pyridine nucleotide transhydrogenase [Paraburkholderia graminis C4D1M]|jgi:dihydrolipoamide dehydrogenase|uniref:Dihydrolipoyl dehydrogenase n=1 Tax=Paraburkholderia graminis (strain ATCC 700544 / DSM 17151 / LMG 18924 / NCIMB 13744 / C4D1M) TaxID=396598 RepID=B1G9S5_PARG4|nr:dihydrolipoyl dehydrogenase [Paraburkholderia graminis]EDT07122.1 dihydrolipoamide dehydrogenase [Paraburkholderia graminis C4D1M]CAB3738914.1 Soluble pyridine nucleotide transhydrogenase [Paraburkholderia graminis C4D1M]
MSLVEVKVPDIGDFKDVDVIEVNIKAGDVIENEQALMTLESDKASIEVPSDAAGTVKEVRVKAGDKVSQGTVIALVETSADAAPAKDAPKAPAKEPEKASAQADAKPQAAAAAPAEAATPAPQAGSFSGNADIECDMLVLGSGPGGYSAAFRSADLGMKTVLVERYSTLGGVCLNVGCIPSKALLHTALVIDEAEALGSHGITFGKPQIDLDKLRDFKSGVVKKLTGGLAGMAKMRKVEVVTGTASFVDPYHMEVQVDGGRKIVKFKQAIIAAGSDAVKLPFIPQDPRVVDSTGALELRQIPQRMLVIGGGIIGLEMATVYATLGAKIDVVEMLDGLMAGADRDLVKVWEKYNSKRFANVMLKTKTTAAEAKDDGIYVSFEGEKAPAEAQRYDLVLVAVGRTPNGKKISADKAGVAVTERGFIEVDKQMRTNVPHIFAIGDIVGQPMLAHKAVHEAHVAAEVAHGEKAYFDALQIPSVAYTDPEVAWAGKTEGQLKAEGIKYGKAVFPWAASGRAIANGRDEGFTKLLFDEETHRVIGGGIVGPNAGDLISEVCLAVEMGADATDIGKTIHPHPTLGESIGMAAELYEGVCTDLPPTRKSAH